jgi:CrcB protein
LYSVGGGWARSEGTVSTCWPRASSAPTIPIGTLSINVIGSFLMGIVAEYFGLRIGLPQPLRLFLTTGIIGGFTTFSTFSLETCLLYERGELGAAVLYMIVSVVVGVGALFVGLALVHFLIGNP